MRKRTRITGLALLAALALALYGCGSGDGGGDQPSTVSKAEYVKQADEICTKTESRQRKLLTQFQKENRNIGNGQAAVEKMISFAALPPMEEEIAELTELPAPGKEAATAKTYVKELEKGVRIAKKEPGTLLLNPGAFTKAQEVAREFGFKICAGA